MKQLNELLSDIKKDYQSLLEEMKLSEKRKLHVEGCIELAYSLAKVYDIDVNKAVLVALLHDFFREVDNKSIIEKAQSLNIEISDFELSYPKVLHGKVAASYFSAKGLIKDKDILEAIIHHTLGSSNVCSLTKLLFIVDALEKHREYEGVEELRKIIEGKSLDNAYIIVLKRTIIDMINKNKVLAPSTIGAYNYMMEDNLWQVMKKAR